MYELSNEDFIKEFSNPINLSESAFDLDLKTKREDDIVISTIKIKDSGYYETAIIEGKILKIVNQYPTEEDVINYHKQYCQMTIKEINKLEPWFN